MKAPTIAALWRTRRADAAVDLSDHIAAGLALSAERPKVFFRADDIGVPGAQAVRLLELFARRRTAINLAVVPAWLTRPRWAALRRAAGPDALCCWHQHGWRHFNHEPRGKKQEFGPSRTAEAVRRDIQCGRQRLRSILGAAFTPVFTPPWNRCSLTTLEYLRLFGYHAVSRSAGAVPAPIEGLPDLQVNVDLHTRREPNAQKDWGALLQELFQALAGGVCGVMIHHRRMNANAFVFLELLLDLLKGPPQVDIVRFTDIDAAHGCPNAVSTAP